MIVIIAMIFLIFNNFLEPLCEMMGWLIMYVMVWEADAEPPSIKYTFHKLNPNNGRWQQFLFVLISRNVDPLQGVENKIMWIND